MPTIPLSAKSGLRAINQGVREVFPEIPESKNLFKQHKANSAYLVDRIEKMKFKVVRDKYKKEIYDAVDREIEVGRTDHLLALLSCGVKLSPKQLKNAAKKKQKEVVRFYLDKCGEEFKNRIIQQEKQNASMGIERINGLSLKCTPFPKIDEKASQVAKELGDRLYSDQLDAIVPFFNSCIRAEWILSKNDIADRIGLTYPSLTADSDSWENSATSIDSLLLDAEKAAPYFRKKCREIAMKTRSVANFGMQDKSIIKSRKSLIRKVKQVMQQKGLPEEKVIVKIRDVLRGTIIANFPEQIPSIVKPIKEFANEEGREAIIENIWEENRPSGYVENSCKNPPPHL